MAKHWAGQWTITAKNALKALWKRRRGERDLILEERDSEKEVHGGRECWEKAVAKTREEKCAKGEVAWWPALSSPLSLRATSRWKRYEATLNKAASSACCQSNRFFFSAMFLAVPGGACRAQDPPFSRFGWHGYMCCFYDHRFSSEGN